MLVQRPINKSTYDLKTRTLKQDQQRIKLRNQVNDSP